MARGSKRRRSATSAPAVELREHPLHAPLGREEEVLLQPLVSRVVVGDEREGKVEAAGTDELEQRLDARSDGSLLPARDHRAVAAGALGQLRLRQAGSQAGLADQGGAPHSRSVSTELDSVIRCRYATRVWRVEWSRDRRSRTRERAPATITRRSCCRRLRSGSTPPSPSSAGGAMSAAGWRRTRS